MTKRLLFFRLSTLAATAALIAAFSLDQYWIGIAGALGVGLFGWFGLKEEKSSWRVDLFFVGVVLLVTTGALRGLATSLLLMAMMAGLGAWDLIRFQHRLSHSPQSEGIHQIEIKHLVLLGLTVLIGGVLAYVLSAVQIQISFGFTLVLGIILIIVLSEVIRLLRNQQ